MRTRAPRRGEEAKNSARLPLRSIFRSHSSADTTMAAFRPRRVIVCGPSASAWSITALKCALALATAQVRVDLAMHCPQIVPIVIIVIWGILQVIGRLSDRACLEYVLAVCGTTLSFSWIDVSEKGRPARLTNRSEREVRAESGSEGIRGILKQSSTRFSGGCRDLRICRDAAVNVWR